MAHAKNHDYHILNPSLWPLIGALFGFIMLFGAVLFFHDKGPYLLLIGFVGVIYVMYGWWAETVAENKEGDHTPVVLIGLRYGFILFIMSEVMFFLAWFWTFFKHAMYPMGEMSPIVDGVWPPVGIETFDPWHLPLINTLILLCSGAAATWAHHALVHEDNREDVKMGLIISIALGAIFTVFQIYEYSMLPLALLVIFMARASSWPPASMVFTSWSERSSCSSACCGCGGAISALNPIWGLKPPHGIGIL